ncbi:Uncharacterised protein [Mycobacteroides abscessus subsp. massiliense]|nr:Uncharacterised protein [Mycobacteroides abscessus subsp. massiliense]
MPTVNNRFAELAFSENLTRNNCHGGLHNVTAAERSERSIDQMQIDVNPDQRAESPRAGFRHSPAWDDVPWVAWSRFA